MITKLDDEHPLWLINEQIKGLLEGDGSNEDHQDVLTFLRATGLPEDTVTRMHRAIVCAEKGEPVAYRQMSSKFHCWDYADEKSDLRTDNPTQALFLRATEVSK